MKRGEVWKVDIPFAPGHAQAGQRRFPGTLLIQPDGQNGLTLPSMALVFQTRVLDQRNCLQRLGVLDVATLDQIFAELDRLTGR